MTTDIVAGMASGSVMLRKRCHALAPSDLAASKYSPGMDRMPAM